MLYSCTGEIHKPFNEAIPPLITYDEAEAGAPAMASQENSFVTSCAAHILIA